MRPCAANLCSPPVTNVFVWSLFFSSNVFNLLIPSIVYHVLLTSSSFHVCLAFNFEPKLPIIKRGITGSYFGYSVAEHIIGDARGLDESVLLVGAPHAKSALPGTNRSGLVFRCPLTTNFDDCTPISFESADDNTISDASVSRDDQWLGVSLKSQGRGGYAVACAHRYMHKGENFVWGQGICYSLNNNLDYQRSWEPCLNRPVAKAHEQFGYCQAGTSVDISPDNDIVIGAPGPLLWRGTIFSNSVRFGIRDDKSWYHGPLTNHDVPEMADKYGYMGMSVITGKFIDGNLYYVTGASRSNRTGKVIFFPKNNSSDTLTATLVLNGEQIASNFGYSLAAVDLNGDNLPDLAVGAPFYYGKTQGGAVYVYLNSPQSLRKGIPAYKLTGKLDSRFGFALASLGDINKDGRDDLAIGAPYDESGGAVYIYLGSKEGMKESPVQVIHGTDLPRQAAIKSTFGYSLSGSLDMDRNGYPDLLVGAYDSDAAVLLRTRPIINLTTSVVGQLKAIDPNRPNCEWNSVKHVCFDFSACFQLDGSSFGVIKLRYKIEAETFTGKKYYRVKFESAAESDTPNIAEKDIVLSNGSRDKLCTKETVYLRNSSDILSPIPFKLTYSLLQEEPRLPSANQNVPDMNKYPILNQEEAHKIFEATFLKDCGSNDICESDLHLEAEWHLPYENDETILNIGSDNINLTLTISNDGEPAYESYAWINHSPSLSYVSRRVISGEAVECLPFNRSVVKCELGNPFPAKGATSLELKFSPRSINDTESRISFNVLVNTTSQDTDTSGTVKYKDMDVSIVRTAELEIKGSSEPPDVFYGGEIKGESSMVHESDIGSLVYHTYSVYNRGPARVASLQVAVDWPYEVNSGKWLLYLVSANVHQGNGHCEPSGDELKLTRKLVPSTTTTSTVTPPVARSSEKRRKGNKKIKRQALLPEEVREDGKLIQVVTMDCTKNTAKCSRHICYLHDLKPNSSAVVKFRARLWNTTFIEDYAYGVNLVQIYSQAAIKIDASLQIRQQRLDNDYTFAMTKAYPDTASLPAPGAPWWAIILAVILGTLLLILLIVILWKLGFFERKKYGHLPGDETTVDKSFESQAFN